MKTFKSILIYSFIIILSIILFEILARVFFFQSIKTSEDKFYDATDLVRASPKMIENYTKQELDSTLSTYHERTGKNCTEKIIPTWHPKIGAIFNKIDYKCLDKHYKPNTLNVAFFGGSVMETDNRWKPNYLTAIDWLAIENNKNIRSINFSQSGSRLSNEFSSFVLMLKHNKPDVAVFLDGVNEFASIKYNSDPDQDYYWTVWAKKRIENPFSIYLETLVRKSFTAKIIIVKIFGYKPLVQPKVVPENKIIESARDYIHYKNLINKLCRSYKIDCIFLLQPVIHLTGNLTDDISKTIIKRTADWFPQNKKIHEIGYKILKKENDIIDLSDAFNGVSYVFYDEVHFNKKGSVIIGKKIAKLLDLSYKKKFQ